MNTDQKKHIIIEVLYYVILIIFIYICFRYLIYYLLPFIVGSFVSILIEPWIQFLSAYTNGHRRLWNFCMLLGFYFICITFIIIFLLLFYYLLQFLISNFPIYYKTIITPFLSSLSSLRINHIPIIELFTTFFSNLKEFFPSFISTIMQHIISLLTCILQKLPSFLFSFSTTILTSFYITFHYPSIIKKIELHCNSTITHSIRFLIQTMTNTLFHICIANINLIIITCLELWFGFLILHIPHPFIKAFGIALFDFLPIVGVGTILIPWCMILYIINQKKIAIGLLTLYLIILCIRNIIEPKLIGKQLDIHPFYILISMYIGSKLFGFTGLLLCPLLIPFMKCLSDIKKGCNSN